MKKKSMDPAPLTQDFYQKTLKAPIALSGVALHSGKAATVRLSPAPIHKGVLFRRSDVPGNATFSAHHRNVMGTQMATTLGRSRTESISTVEHLMAALYGLGIDNVLVEVDGPELPILDGSSLPYVEAILEVGVESQRASRTVVRLRKKVEVKIGEKWAVAEPSEDFSIMGSIDWDHPCIGFQSFHYVDGRNAFSELAGARTFGFLKEVDHLKKLGLALGGSLENAVVLDEERILNPEGLRFADEFARHKVLDAIGDLALSGVRLTGRFRLHRAGHDLHAKLLSEIFRFEENYEILDASRSVEQEQGVPMLQTAKVAV
jgi:UDP-3-O-[3-hydroxymyristoyl] N-acetylglucosamine deacetylase